MAKGLVRLVLVKLGYVLLYEISLNDKGPKVTISREQGIMTSSSASHIGLKWVCNVKSI